MAICKCEKVEWLETLFGVVIFMVILFLMKDQAILMFEQMEWYRALAISLGGIMVIGSISLISSFAAVWVTEHIVFVTITVGILWIARYTVL